jgi:hypothetical protein
MYGKQSRVQHIESTDTHSATRPPGKQSLTEAVVQQRAGADGAAPIPGKRTLTNAIVVQQRTAPGATAADSDALKTTAADGLVGSGETLPHVDRIQRAFGHHEVAGVRAHVGGEAAVAAARMRAQAYASDEQVAFAQPPGLHTAAHEAAHIIQQRAGVQLADGFGRSGDAYERHADQVADAVVAGHSAQMLLDQMVTASTGAAVHGQVQHRTDNDAELVVERANARIVGDELIRTHRSPAALASAILQIAVAEGSVFGGRWEQTAKAYYVLDHAPDRAGLLAAVAAQLPNDRVKALSNVHGALTQFLMSISRRLREAGNIAEAERMLSVLVGPEHAHLLGELATASPFVQGALASHNATVQSVTDGTGTIVYDYYWIIMDAMPARLTPADYLTEMSTDLNAAVQNEAFDTLNVFQRTQQDRLRGGPQIGDVYDIDILGPDNGSVMLVERTASHFIFQTVQTSQTGKHPENGSREFGFELLEGGAVKWYTRGCSRPADEVTRIAGGMLQKRGWTKMMEGIGDALERRGGKLRKGSLGHWKRLG